MHFQIACPQKNPRKSEKRRTVRTCKPLSLTFIPFLLRMYVQLFRLHCSYVWLIGFSVATHRKGERARKIQFRVRPRKNNAARSYSHGPLVKSRFQYEGRIFNSAAIAPKFHAREHVVGTKDHV